MYYLLIPVISSIFFIRIFTSVAEDINHRVKNFDYKYSIALRSDMDLESYISNLNVLNNLNINLDSNHSYEKDLKIFPPYSDYNINQNFDSASSALTLFDKD